ncbi:succinylglutamate desuccinylase [Aliidiomarina quisquiliarum]|uniref:succinylglutamate desuccinylase n=1 Tax=Aliidiomarina quisquiliarum TaxID=2938947 RepID=UPI00208F3EEC|nr:succinylglutamate desuccinylase [Aliidiomarina quisquiliarum]MCO4320077.1 succinylglutamate desuccinylase [Aliidiomarina quisquiliarum]
MILQTSFLAWTRANEWHAEALAPVKLANGTLVEIWDSGVIVFTPPNPNNCDIILSCAVHGDETAPIELCDDLIERLRNGQLVSRSRLMFLIANPAAINVGRRFVEENMNRLFSGAHSTGPGLVNKERERTKNIESYVARFYNQGIAFQASGNEPPRERLHYDMHTAIRDSAHEKFAIYPYQNGQPYKARQLQLLKAMGVPVILLHDGPTTTCSYFSVNEFGANAFTLELGKVRPFGQNDMSRFASVKTMLEALITDTLELDQLDPDDVLIYQVLRSINRTQENFELNFPDNVANFTEFPLGYDLARDGELTYPVEVEGESVVFPNAKVALGQRALLTVVAIPTESLDLV